MKIQILSDIHTEFQVDRGAGFLARLAPGALGVDVCVLAGDITQLSVDGTDFIKKVCDLYPRVILVAGNHEYYGGSIQSGYDILTNLVVSNLDFLDDSCATVCGHKFVGTSMWYKPSYDVKRRSRDWSDFLLIKDIGRCLEQLNYNAQEFLDKEVTSDSIVVTHFVPLHSVNHPQYIDSIDNCFFVTDQYKLISDRAPKLWIHGHTHYANRTVLPNGTVVRCNAYGYEDENDLVDGFSFECYEEI